MDIRDAIGVSFSWSQFVKEMEKRGYTWKLNRKYPALKTPDMERYVRLRSLGKGYGEAEIREKILRPKIQQVYGKTQVQFPKRKLILLDEATASLDPENEVLVQKAIAKLVEGKTVIMIAHRLRTVVDADQILVLDNGKLVEYGTHEKLMKKNGLYHKLFHIQQESLGWAV